MNRMKSWMPRMPSGVIGFAARDPRFLLILAYYHATIVAAEPYVPVAIGALFPLKRTEIIGRIYDEIEVMKISQPSDLQVQARDVHDMMTVPLLYATRYRTAHGVISLHQ